MEVERADWVREAEREGEEYSKVETSDPTVSGNVFSVFFSDFVFLTLQ